MVTKHVSLTLWNIVHDKAQPDIEIMLYDKLDGKITRSKFMRVKSYRKALRYINRAMSENGRVLSGLAKPSYLLLNMLIYNKV